MPKETDRTTARKRVKLPNDEIVEVAVITKISFTDPSDRYQETQHTIDNTEASGRKVHEDYVFHTEVDKDGNPEDPENPDVFDDEDSKLFVERIDVWPATDATDRGQETHLKLDNVTGFDSAPPRFVNHEKTHIYRYYQDPTDPDDDGAWIDVEFIDEFRVVDAEERYQETRLVLTNPTNAETRDGDTWGQAQQNDPDITMGGGDTDSGEGTLENPVRLDPFQNIVNFSGVPKAYWCCIEDPYGEMWSSADGLNWVKYQGPFDGSVGTGVYGNGMWVLTGDAYQGDEVFVTARCIKSTNLFDWETVYDEGPTGGEHFLFWEEDKNRFRLHRYGFTDDTGQGEDIYIDNPFPPGKFGGAVQGFFFPDPPNDYPTLSNGSTWLQQRGDESSNEIWCSKDAGKNWQLVVGPTTFKTCAAPWGFQIPIIGEEMGDKFPKGAKPSGSAPGLVDHNIQVGSFIHQNEFPPVKWEVHFFTQAWDAGTKTAGAIIHVTRFNAFDPENPVTRNQTTEMRNVIQNPNYVGADQRHVWQRDYSGSPPGNNYVEFHNGQICFSSPGATDTANDHMIQQCLQGFNFAVANPQLFVMGDFIAPYGQAWEFPSLHGFYPVGEPTT